MIKKCFILIIECSSRRKMNMSLDFKKIFINLINLKDLILIGYIVSRRNLMFTLSLSGCTGFFHKTHVCKKPTCRIFKN